MLVTKAGRALGVRATDSYERIHDRAWEFFAGMEGFWSVVVVATPEFVDVYILFHSAAARDAALRIAPPGFSRGPAETIFAEALVDLFGRGGEDVQ